MNDVYLDIRLDENSWIDEGAMGASDSWPKMVGGGSGNIEGGSGAISPDWDV